MTNDFLEKGKMTIIYGAQAAFQSEIAEQVAFAMCAGVAPFHDPTLAPERKTNVVLFCDGSVHGETLLQKFASWSAARGLTTPPDNLHIFNARNLDGKPASTFFADMEARDLTPDIIISGLSATDGQGTESYGFFQEAAISKVARKKIGCAILLATHTQHLRGEAGNLGQIADVLWCAKVVTCSKVLLKREARVITLNGKMAGGNGRMPLVYFEAEDSLEDVL